MLNTRKILFVMMVTLSFNSFASTCGSGKVLTIFEGAWNQDNLMIKLDYSRESSAHPDTLFQEKYIRFSSDLSESRISGIKAIALAAYMSGETVRVYSHSNSCSEATELSIGYFNK